MANAAEGKTIAQLLIESAAQDVAACKLLSAEAGIGDAVVGFHAQQAVEKSIKAILSQNGIEFRRTHDLITLLDLLQDMGMPAPPNADWLDELTPYAVEARYGTLETTGLDRTRVLMAIEAVLAWAHSQIASSSRP